MNRGRRAFLKWAATAACGALTPRFTLWAAGFSRDPSPLTEPIVGVNAYYLLVESYRKVRTHRTKTLSSVRSYLKDEIQLFRLRDRSRLNTLRFWAFNDYPEPNPKIAPGAFDGRLWDGPENPNRRAFDVLEALVEALAETELRLIPVLGNFWPSYGGILQYLVWAEELSPQAYFMALCSRNSRKNALYLEHTARFYMSRRVEHCFRAHVSRVLRCLARNPRVILMDVLNEPRGKTPYSLKKKKLEDGSTMSDVVARWLNRQGAWIKSEWRRLTGKECRISSGEEGWSESPSPVPCRALISGSQYYEGVDLVKNVSEALQGVDVGSVHMYPHATVEMKRRDVCGRFFLDRRGWEHLLRPDLPKTPENFQRMALEWIASRARLLGDRPWYMGEMGWNRPRSPTDLRPHPSNAIQKERGFLYRLWHETVLNSGGLGTCLWMLNGVEHKDGFYGLSPDQLIQILSG